MSQETLNVGNTGRNPVNSSPDNQYRDFEASTWNLNTIGKNDEFRSDTRRSLEEEEASILINEKYAVKTDLKDIPFERETKKYT